MRSFFVHSMRQVQTGIELCLHRKLYLSAFGECTSLSCYARWCTKRVEISLLDWRSWIKHTHFFKRNEKRMEKKRFLDGKGTENGYTVV